MPFPFFVPRKYFLALTLAAVFFVALPYIHISSQLGEAPRVPVGAYNDADYYFERMREVKDGYPFLGNPYFIEHRDDPAPAFFVADWLAAIPLLLGIPLMATISINFFLWSLAFLLLSYLILRRLEVSPALSFFGSLIVFSEAYLFMIRPVSMQVIFPFFLLFLFAYFAWLQEHERRRYQIFLALSGAAAAYLYTYSWQIILVIFLLTPIALYVVRRRDMVVSALVSCAVFFLATIPLVLITVQQLNHPLYFETLERIGLIHTRLPIFAAFFLALVPVSLALLAYLLRKEGTLRWISSTPIFFFGITALSMLGVMFSNVITGTDLELPQHVERFIILWFGFASIYLLHPLVEFFRSVSAHVPKRLVVVLLLIFIVLVHTYWEYRYGPPTIFAPYDVSYMRSVQEFAKPLGWLSENVREPSVVWADPDGALNSYLTMLTQHYALFRASGVLHLASNEELEDRYLVAHYFSLAPEYLVEDYHAYGGVGNAIHQYKTHNRKVRVCRMLQLDSFGVSCGEITDRATYKGKEYFDGLYKKYESEIRPRIEDKLAQYGVGYIIADRETDPPEFHPEALPDTSVIYSDGRFTIYRYAP